MDILPHVLKTSLYTLIMNGLAVWIYKKTN